MGSSEIRATSGRDADLLYMKVAEDIVAKIASGELESGDRLLSEKDLANHYGVSNGTMRHALKILRDRGLIVSRHGRGTFVAEAPGEGSP
jgi:GntR family transcriptional regulator